MSLTSGYKSKQTFVGVGEAKRVIESSYSPVTVQSSPAKRKNKRNREGKKIKEKEYNRTKYFNKIYV